MNLHARAVRRCSLVVIVLGFTATAAFPQVLKGSRIPLNVKLGLWEMTTVAQMSGMPPIDTKDLTPQQKVQMEAAMKAMQQNAAKPHTERSCLTKEKLEKGFFDNDKQQSCKQTVLESTSTTYGIKFECSDPSHPSTGEMHFVAVTPEMVKGTGTFTIAGKEKMTSTSTSTGKWLGAECGNVK